MQKCNDPCNNNRVVGGQGRLITKCLFKNQVKKTLSKLCCCLPKLSFGEGCFVGNIPDPSGKKARKLEGC